MTKSGKTKKRHPTGIPAKKRLGGQPDNTNAAKPVHRQSTLLAARIRDLKARVRAALAAIP